MKIGILTYHRSHNYGALLQAFALKYFLKQHGYDDVEFVDYYPNYHWKMYDNITRRKFSNLTIKQKIKYPFYLVIRHYPLFLLKEKRRQNFNKFIKKYLIKKVEGVKDFYYDVVIYGSDQIWRKQNQETCPGFNDMYFGNGAIKAKKRIAFSASMGIIDLNFRDKEYLVKSLNKFYAISVREQELFDVISSLVKFPIKHTLDPVFLLKKEDWEKIIPKRIVKGKYILFYNLHKNEEAREIAEHIRLKFRYKTVELIGEINRINYPSSLRIFDGPENFLSLIKYADFIVSSSFHGIALSIIFEKQFYASLTWNNQRVVSLLKSFGLSERLISNVEDVNLFSPIDYIKINPIVKNEIKNTKEFLFNSV